MFQITPRDVRRTPPFLTHDTAQKCAIASPLPERPLASKVRSIVFILPLLLLLNVAERRVVDLDDEVCETRGLDNLEPGKPGGGLAKGELECE